MRRLFILSFCSLMLIATGTFGDEGLIRQKSAYDVKTTADRLARLIRKKGLRIFTRVDYGKGAKRAGLELRPTESILFGNPKMGTPLMQCRQEIALDLPLKALIFRDPEGQVWIAYTDPTWLAQRYQLGSCGQTIIRKMKRVLKRMTTAAAGG